MGEVLSTFDYINEWFTLCPVLRLSKVSESEIYHRNQCCSRDLLKNITIIT